MQSGDTLSGIAASLWGDSSLWYLIADAWAEAMPAEPPYLVGKPTRAA